MGDLPQTTQSSNGRASRDETVGMQAIGELGALSHLDRFVFSTHSPLDLVSSNFLDEPFGDEVPHNPTTMPTPHIPSPPHQPAQHSVQVDG